MSFIKQWIPASAKKSIRDFIKRKFNFSEDAELNKVIRKKIREEKRQQENDIPKYELSDKHIAHLNVFLHRDVLLEALPKDSICAEIGVDEGEFSRKIMDITKPRKLHLIDAWGDPTRYHDNLKLVVKDRLKKEIDAGIVYINVGFSTDVLKTFPDSYFDWVYLDTDHSYATTAQELSILKSKMKNEGIISGHDYYIGNWIEGIRYGVIEAVHEFCVKEGWELLYLTNETSQVRSFAIKKLS